MEKLISFDLRGDFGMLKKPDTNEPVYLTFNMLHKPALLGIIGSILGLRGFEKQKELPEYYQKLQGLKIGIEPLNHESGNFSKTVIKYNNGTGMASEEQGGNLIIAEQNLINPAFKCYVLLNLNSEIGNKVRARILNYSSEYIPYFGKNECSIWWENAKELEYEFFNPTDTFKIKSLFVKDQKLRHGDVEEVFSLFTPKFTLEQDQLPYMYFERLPISYLGAPLFQYDYKNFAFTNSSLKAEYRPTDDLPLLKLDSGEVIQIF